MAAAVRFARDCDLQIAVRGGGHNVAGTAVCEDGIVIDLSAMRAVSVDPVDRTALVQGGALWGDVDHETQAHGLATTGGIVGHTGVGGLALGGGIGWLMRKHGLTVDNLVQAEMVTASGDIVRTSTSDHPELFWALRGGGGNFGVVTSFRFALHPVGPTVIAGPVFWAAPDTTDVLRFYRDFVDDAPDELGTVIRLGTLPPLPVIDSDLHFRPAIAVTSCYAGPLDAGERAVRALRQFGTPLLDLVGPTLYVDHQGGIDDTVPHGWHYYWKATNLTDLSDAVIDIVAEHAYDATSRRSYAAMFHMGGAVARVPRGATAYPGRDVEHNIVIDAAWLPEQDDTVAAAETAWARNFLDALEPHRAGVYVNFLDADDDTSRVREAYGDANYRRLVQVKAQYDPENVFRNNKNIQPTTPTHQPRSHSPRKLDAAARSAHLGDIASRRTATNSHAAAPSSRPPRHVPQGAARTQACVLSPPVHSSDRRPDRASGAALHAPPWTDRAEWLWVQMVVDVQEFGQARSPAGTESTRRALGDAMGPLTLVGERRVAGSLLVSGFAVLVVAAFLYGDGDYPAGQTWQSNALTVGLVLTLLGLTAFQVVLTDSGDRLLAQLGMIAYLVGVVLWIVGDSIDLAGGTPVFLERNYVVLACLAIAAFGAAILRTPVLPRWVGGLAVVWAVVWTVLYLTGIAEAPLGPNLVPALFGLELLVHRPSS